MPGGAVIGAQHLVLHLRFRDRRAEKVFCLDRGGYFFAQADRLFRGLDPHVELGLLVLFDAEAPPAVIDDEQLVNAQRRSLGERDFAVEPTEFVGRIFLFEELFSFGVVDLYRESPVAERRRIGLVVFGMLDPELELDGLAGPVDRTVGDRKHLRLVVFGVVVIVVPDPRKTQVGEAAVTRASDDQPLMILRQLLLRENHLSVLVGELGEVGDDSLKHVLVWDNLNLLPAEEFDVGFRDRQPGRGIRHIIERLAVQLFFDNHRVGHPQDDAAHVSAGQLCGHQVCARFLERRGHRDAVVDMFGARLQIEVPGGDPGAHILQFVLLHEPLPDVGDIRLVPIKLVRAALEISFHVGQKFVDVDFPGLERNAIRVAEPKLDSRSFACLLRLDVIEPAPVADDLVEARAAEIVLTGAVVVNGPLPGSGRCNVLSAVFENLSQRVDGLFSETAFTAGGNLPVQLDEVEFVGQLEPLDSRGQAGDRFFFGQRVHRVGATFVLLRVVVAAERHGEMSHRLHTELLAQEIGKCCLGFVHE